MKGALSVATSAYKALFSGPPVTAQVSAYPSLPSTRIVILQKAHLPLGRSLQA